jgi:poly [ADP-ribose] polymerase 6/8
VDLLLEMAKHAAASDRRLQIFRPFPLVFDPHDKCERVLDPERCNYDKAQALLKKIPPIKQLLASAGAAPDIPALLARIDPYAHPLLTWVIGSNRSHIVKLPPQVEISELMPSEQFLMLSSSPEREEAFQKLKARHGTVLAFHGSPIENWHCIIRTGLKNGSGTSLQLHGAAHGSGIYFSPNSTVSLQYCQVLHAAQRRGSEVASSDFFNCIALCEIINTPEIKKTGDIWVVPNEIHVVTRLFFVFHQMPARGVIGGEIVERVHAAERFFGVL